MSVKIHNKQIKGYELPVMVINLKNRSIISVPTQIGCPIGCTFCISSKGVFKRNLTSKEMIELINFGFEHVTNKKALVSFTGEGEPFLNLKNVNSVIFALDSDKRVDCFRVCTSGIRPDLFPFVCKISKPINIQLSLHSPFDEKRKELIPNTRGIKEIIASLKLTTNHFNEVAINYVLMKDFNDREEDLDELIRVVDSRWLIKLNPLMDEDVYKKSDKKKLFENTLSLKGKNVVSFNKIGSTIKNELYEELAYN